MRLIVVIVCTSTVDSLRAAVCSVTLTSCAPSARRVVLIGITTRCVCGQGCWEENISAPVAGSVPTGAQRPALVFGVAS